MPPKRKAQKQKACAPKKDYSRSLSVRMTEEQYQQLQRYMKLTRLTSTTYFRHLINGNTIRGHSPKLNRAMHAGVNKIYSNVKQISRHQRAKEMDAEAVAKMVFLMDKLCEETCLLTSRK